MNNEPKFQIVTQELLETMHLKYYSSGKKLKEGDLIISGFTICGPTSIGVQTSNLTIKEASYLNIVLFVLDKEQQMLHQLYNQI